MTSSESSSPQPLENNEAGDKRSAPRWIAWAFLIGSLIGFADATFLAVEHFRGVAAPCTLVEGCEQVLTSAYATIGPVPVALIGSFYYFALFLLAARFLARGERRVLVLAAWLAVAGLLATVRFVYLQLFVIGAICLYCMLSAFVSVALGALGVKVLRRA